MLPPIVSIICTGRILQRYSCQRHSYTFTIQFLKGFTVRPGSSAKFEKRWADRSSRLASLEGFKYFHLMRRVGVDDKENSGE